MSLKEFNGVRSTIVDQGTPPPAVTVTRDRTFIFGTASAGPIHTPISPTTENVKNIFGSVPIDSSFDTSLVRGYYEYIDSCVGIPEVALVRVGDVNAARIDLYENIAASSGDLSYTLNNSQPEYSLWISALTEGAIYNEAKVTVNEDEESGNPNFMKIELPDGSSSSYNLSPVLGSAGIVSRVSDLVDLINANEDFAGKIQAGFDPLVTEVTVDITRTLIPGTVDQYTIDRTYNIDPVAPGINQSWGDKMVGLLEVYQQREIENKLDAGSTNAELTVTPEKNMTEGTETISDFIRVSNLESVLTVTPVIAGQSNYVANLYCKSVSGWDNSYDISANTSHGWVFRLYVKRNGSSSYVELEKYDPIENPGGKYTINPTSGEITIVESLSIGDVYYASYRYKVGYVEAKLKSNLLSGSDRQYFIYGSTIIFGADQPSDLFIYYDAKSYFDNGDVKVDDFDSSIITFINADNLPLYGIDLMVKFQYEPELPAATARVLPGGVVQPGSLSGGKDGRIVSPQQYKKNVIDALKAVDLYPRRRMVVMGMYLDDVVSGYNEETGLPEDVLLNMHSDILPYVDRASHLTNECTIEIPVRPLNDLSQASINDWIVKLTEVSPTDLNRPANAIDAINNFRADAPLGVFIGAISDVNNGRRYFMNPACIYAAYKQNLSITRASTGDFIPGNIKDLGVKIFNAEVIGKLNEKRYTAAVVDFGGRFIWADAPTLALKYRSQFDRQFVRDTVYIAVGIAREAASKYIGKARSPINLVTMKKDIGKALSVLVPDIIVDLYVSLVPVSDGHITGRSKVRLMLVTATDNRTVDIETTITLAR